MFGLRSLRIAADDLEPFLTTPDPEPEITEISPPEPEPEQTELSEADEPKSKSLSGHQGR